MRNEEVELRARQFCEEHGINEYPVRIVDICKKLGLGVFEEYMNPEISGLIVVDEAEWDRYKTNQFIVVNQYESPERRRFTIAHELAHYVLHRNGETLYAHRDIIEGNDLPPRIEVEANYFATNILMPADLVTERVYDLKAWRNLSTGAIIRDIAYSFLVSNKAAEVRLKQLKLI